MNNILIILIVSAILIAGCVPLVIMYFKERKARLKSEKALAVVIEMGQIDDQIFRIRLDQSESWPASSRAKMLIARRIELHDWYSTFLGHQQLRDCSYMNDLMKSVISK